MTVNEILDQFVECVSKMQASIGIWWSIVKHKQLSWVILTLSEC